MKLSPAIGLALLIVCGTASAQDAYTSMYNQMLQGEAQKQAVMNAYIEKHGYENLYAEYATTCSEVAQYGYDCSTLPFETHLWLKIQEEAGIDTRRNFQVGLDIFRKGMVDQDRNFRATQRGIADLGTAYDRSNIGWEDNQRTIDQVYADRSAVDRGTWDFSNGYPGDDAVTLPHAPDPDDVYTDGYYYYQHNGDDWLQYENDRFEGPGVIMQALPNVVD